MRTKLLQVCGLAAVVSATAVYAALFSGGESTLGSATSQIPSTDRPSAPFAELSAQLDRIGERQRADRRELSEAIVQTRDALNETRLLRADLEALAAAVADRIDRGPAATAGAKEPRPAPKGRERDAFESFEQSFRLQREDTSWSPSAVSAIEEAFEQDVAALRASALVSADCRAEMCRVVVENFGEEAAAEFGLEFPLAVASQFGTTATTTRERGAGVYETVVYLGRTGMPLRIAATPAPDDPASRQNGTRPR